MENSEMIASTVGLRFPRTFLLAILIAATFLIGCRPAPPPPSPDSQTMPKLKSSPQPMALNNSQKPPPPPRYLSDPLGQMTPPPRSFSNDWPLDAAAFDEITEQIRSVFKANRTFSSFFPDLLEIAEHLAPEPHMVIADIGAGTGMFCLTLLEHGYPIGKLYAVDVVKQGLDLLAFCLAQGNYEGGKRVEIVPATQDNVSVPPNELDLAVVINSPFFMVKNAPSGTVAVDNTEWFGSLHKAMKSNGRVHIFNSSSILNTIKSDEQLIGPFERNGFRLQKKETIDCRSHLSYLHFVFVKK
jgi:predicted RNA methylase